MESPSLTRDFHKINDIRQEPYINAADAGRLSGTPLLPAPFLFAQLVFLDLATGGLWEPVDDLQPLGPEEAVEEFLEYKQVEGVRDSTDYNYRGRLESFLAFCEEEEIEKAQEDLRYRE